MIVAIDGPAASGKSTVAKALADRLGFSYLDTGAMYRAIALLALERGVSLDDEAAVAAIAGRTLLEFEGEPLPTVVLADGADVTRAIRTPEVDASVSAVARMPEVREKMVEQQRRIADGRDMVVEGRDIGTVVFPDAPVKVYLTASEDERARRRAIDMENLGHKVGREVVKERLVRRDEKDSTRAASPLRPAEDAIMLDTTGLSIEQVVDRISEMIAKAI